MLPSNERWGVPASEGRQWKRPQEGKRGIGKRVFSWRTCDANGELWRTCATAFTYCSHHTKAQEMVRTNQRVLPNVNECALLLYFSGCASLKKGRSRCSMDSRSVFQMPFQCSVPHASVKGVTAVVSIIVSKHCRSTNRTLTVAF